MEERKIILGIDPGTIILGYGVISVDSHGPRYEDMGTFELKKIRDPYEKLANIYAGVSELIETWHPTALAAESPFYGKNAQVILKLGRAQGAAMTAAAIHGVEVHEYAPREAKIAICGNGAASKEQVAEMLRRTLDVKLEARHLDATDALALALCHYYRTSSPLARARKASAGGWKAFLAANPDRVK